MGMVSMCSASSSSRSLLAEAAAAPNPVLVMLVNIVPGQMALTVMLCSASSLAMTWVSPTTANLEAE